MSQIPSSDPAKKPENPPIPSVEHLQEMGFSDPVGSKIREESQRIHQLLHSEPHDSDAVVNAVNTLMDQYRSSSDAEESELNPLQLAWLESHFREILLQSELKLTTAEKQQLTETVQEMEKSIAASGMSKEDLSKMARLGKLPGWLVRKAIAVGNLGVFALLIVVGMLGYASLKLALSSAVQTEANLRAGEEIGKKIDPARRARDAMDENIRLQAQTVQEQEKILGDLNRIRSQESYSQFVNALERVYRNEFLEAYMARSLFGLGESALRARNDLGDNESVNDRVNTYSHGLLLLMRTQVDTAIKKKVFEQQRQQWLRVSQASATERSPSENPSEDASLTKLRNTRDFLDRLLVQFGNTEMKINPLNETTGQRILRIDLNQDGDTDDRGEQVPGVPFRREYQGMSTTDTPPENLIDLDLSTINVEGLLPQGADSKAFLEAVLRRDPVIDIRLLNAFVRSTRNREGVLYEIRQRFQAAKTRFEATKSELTAFENGLPADRAQDILKEIHQEIAGQWPTIRATQETARVRIDQNLQDTIELEKKFQAVKQKYHLDDAFVRGALRFARWIYGDPLADITPSGSSSDK